ncbi:PrsW family intramembrane metalloprotease, partial [Arthrobacter sp. HMWF013]
MSMHPHAPDSGEAGHAGQRPGQPGLSAESQAYFPGQANPSWMGRVEPEYYRPAPGHAGTPLPSVGPALVGAGGRGGGMRSAGLTLMVGGAALVFLSLFLVVPFLLANTGVSGFAVGFVVSLIPLTAVLLTVHAIDRWEPEPKRLLFFAFTWGAAVSVAVT